MAEPSSSACCSTRSIACTTTTFVRTPKRRCAAACSSRSRASAARASTHLAGAGAARCAAVQRAAAVSDRAGQRHVPRPDLLPRAARAGDSVPAAPIAAIRSVGRRLRDRRRGVLARDPARTKRSCSTRVADLRDRHQPRLRCDRAAKASTTLDALRAVHRELPRGRRHRARCPTTTPRRTAARSWIAACKQAIVFSDHSLATDSVFAEVQLVSCRNVLIYFEKRAAGARARPAHRRALPDGLSRARLQGDAAVLAARAAPTPNTTPEARIYRKL